MTSDTPKSEAEKTAAQVLNEMATAFEKQMMDYNEAGQRIAKGTVLIIKVSLFILFITAAITFFFIFSFSDDLIRAVGQMEDMYKRFGKMSGDMHTITTAMQEMDRNVSGIPVIAGSMVSMNQSVNGMRRDVNSMSQNIVRMNQDMGAINGGVGEMANRFDHLNRTVHGMRYNVNQMSGPVYSLPAPLR